MSFIKKFKFRSCENKVMLYNIYWNELSTRFMGISSIGANLAILVLGAAMVIPVNCLYGNSWVKMVYLLITEHVLQRVTLCSSH